MNGEGRVPSPDEMALLRKMEKAVKDGDNAAALRYALEAERVRETAPASSPSEASPTHSLDSRCTVQGCPECDHAPEASS